VKRLLPFIIIVFGTGPVSGGTPSGEEILGRVEENFRGVDDYTVTLEITVDLERLSVPPMNVTMYFKQPDKVHFSSKGFALLPKESMAFTTSGLLAHFDAEQVEERRDSAGLRYDVTLKPKKDKTGLRRLVLTVNPEHWVAERLAAPQFDGRIMEAEFRHERVDGHWLPTALDVTFNAPDVPEQEPTLPGTPRSPVPRNGRISVRFSHYLLNSGLDDSVFKESEPD
jgi:outer membrane lipoprotein-sorting protein